MIKWFIVYMINIKINGLFKIPFYVINHNLLLIYYNKENYYMRNNMEIIIQYLYILIILLKYIINRYNKCMIILLIH